jgi:hypothetical protein
MAFSSCFFNKWSKGDKSLKLLIAFLTNIFHWVNFILEANLFIEKKIK